MKTSARIAVKYEFACIYREFGLYKQLVELCKTNKPGIIEKDAACMFLHSFYTGIEKIIIHVLAGYNKKIPDNKRWHIIVLNSAFEKIGERSALINITLQKQLHDYLKFRQYIRRTCHITKMKKVLCIYSLMMEKFAKE